MNHLLNPAVEQALRTFLNVMRLESARRHPQHVENSVPHYDKLTPVDRAILLNAIGRAVQSHNAVADVARKESGTQNTSRASVSTV